ncbi:MAG: hypothetical protein OXC92_00935 [Flavobacteriaceae bacterium]|nr:hypothetical protein [Flavobacteriaceae bacterium]
MKAKEYPLIKIHWDDKQGIPKYEIPLEYYKIYNPPDQLVLKYPLPEIITNALQELFRNQSHLLDQIGANTMEGLNTFINQIIKDYINQSKEGFTEHIAQSGGKEQLN